ncbi:MAG: polysaccharide deacetylase family protein [bacterium]|jgi:peptidoglycan/xylan/chitin deacetylase (PgdA/CDA1 family)
MRKLYKKLRSNLTPEQKGMLTKLVFMMPNKPSVLRDKLDPSSKFPGGEKGGMMISADFELAWAWRFTKTGADPLKMARQARKNFPVIIDTLDRYHVPITFATVGHLFLEKCAKGDHDWMTPVPHYDDHWKFTKGGWFQHDPYSDVKKDKEWYAPDLIRMIQEAKAKHEISTHTFSHIDFSNKLCPPEVAKDDIRACMEAMKPYGLKPESIVFPGGTYGNIEVLKQYGFKIYRKNINVDMAYPYRDEHGLLVTPTSLGFMRDFMSWSADYYVYRFKTFLDRAVRTGTIAHFWFHPSFDEWTRDNVFPEVMEYAAELRDKGDLWIGPMINIANHINTKK